MQAVQMAAAAGTAPMRSSCGPVTCATPLRAVGGQVPRGGMFSNIGTGVAQLRAAASAAGRPSAGLRHSVTVEASTKSKNESDDKAQRKLPTTDDEDMGWINRQRRHGQRAWNSPAFRAGRRRQQSIAMREKESRNRTRDAGESPSSTKQVARDMSMPAPIVLPSEREAYGYDNNVLPTARQVAFESTKGAGFKPAVHDGAARARNTEIARLQTPEEVLSTCDAANREAASGQSPALTAINAGTALHRVASLLRSRSEIERLEYGRDPRVQTLVAQTTADVLQLDLRGLSSAAWSLAALGGANRYRSELEEVSQELAAAADRQKITEQQVANTVWALATCRHSSDKVLESLCASACRRGARRYRPSELSQLLWGLAVLNHHPGDDFLESIPEDWEVKGQERGARTAALCDYSTQQLCNIAWALAVLGVSELERPQFARLWSEIVARGAEEVGRDHRHLLQVYQVAMSIEVETSLAGDLLGAAAEPLLAEAEAAWQKEVELGARVMSFYQRELTKTLLSLGVPFNEEDASSGYSIDVTIPTHKVAMEADGPSHLSRTTLEVLGHTALKKRHLGALGWQSVNVPYYEWDALRGPREKALYVERQLRPLVGKSMVPPEMEEEADAVLARATAAGAAAALDRAWDSAVTEEEEEEEEETTAAMVGGEDEDEDEEGEGEWQAVSEEDMASDLKALFGDFGGEDEAGEEVEEGEEEEVGEVVAKGEAAAAGVEELEFLEGADFQMD